jgi:hypothetical protein
MSINWIKRLFLVAALYDGVLGLAFLIAPAEIFVMYGVEPPNHMAFVQFPAFLLIIFAIMFYRVNVDSLGVGRPCLPGSICAQLEEPQQAVGGGFGLNRSHPRRLTFYNYRDGLQPTLASRLTYESMDRL